MDSKLLLEDLFAALFVFVFVFVFIFAPCICIFVACSGLSFTNKITLLTVMLKTDNTIMTIITIWHGGLPALHCSIHNTVLINIDDTVINVRVVAARSFSI